MIINKKSWHYRWMNYCYKRFNGISIDSSNARYFDEMPPKTLCSYFWRCAGYLPAYLGHVIFVQFWFSSWTTFLCVILYSAVHNHSKWSLALLLLIGLFSLIIAVIAGINKLVDIYTDYDALEGMSFVRVTREFLKAKKNKVCPMITYRD